MSEQPDPVEITLACIMACLAAAAPTILFGALAVIAFPVGLFIAALHMVVIGLPLYLLLRRRWWVDWGQALTAGFLVGFTPITIIYGYGWLRAPEIGSFPFVGVLLAGVCGLLGGAAFRATIGPPADPPAGEETVSVFR